MKRKKKVSVKVIFVFLVFQRKIIRFKQVRVEFEQIYHVSILVHPF